MTVLAVCIFILMATFWGYRSYQANVTLPDLLQNSIISASEGHKALSMDQLNQQALAEQERTRVKASLTSTLAASTLPDTESGVTLLLGDVTGYLNDSVQFSRWINQQLTNIDAPSEQWLIDESTSDQRLITAGSFCLVTEKHPESWQLSSFSLCTDIE